MRELYFSDSKDLTGMGFVHGEREKIENATYLTDLRFNRTTGELYLLFGSQYDLNQYWKDKDKDPQINTYSDKGKYRKGMERVQDALANAGVAYEEAQTLWGERSLNPRNPMLIIAHDSIDKAAKALISLTGAPGANRYSTPFVIHEALQRAQEEAVKWQNVQLKWGNAQFGAKSIDVVPQGRAASHVETTGVSAGGGYTELANGRKAVLSRGGK